ncbi:hypothetical protein SLEP1_g30106 [Rubroshorea leprosula]|uniref:rhamnogalacturonan endolyase n=1 Tax=Rubroshorea leprosula TaxID=152421 RepID=A0AAV5K701_9ROSI|nr:hypothetical protein SLEP1_g30106 [Rubroshorea leprosula]
MGFAMSTERSRSSARAPSPPVQLSVQDKYVVIGNGMVQVTISKPEGNITGIQYNGIDNLLEVENEEPNRGLEGKKFQVIVENENQVEISFTRMWDPSLEGKVAPLNIDKRFVMLRGSSGLYTYGTYEHLEGWPAFNLDRSRIAFKLRKDKFHYMAVADNRQRYMPRPEDRLPYRSQQLAYPEAVILVDPLEKEFTGEVDDKYQYSCETENNMVHGWICNEPPVGFWQITPSNEFRTAGPVKQYLTSHVGPTTLAVLHGVHYAGEELIIRFGPKEAWKKVFGPIFIYLNSSSSGGDPISLLWNDAKKQLMSEVQSWPYNFPASEDFPRSDKRGTISGRLLVKDSFVSGENIPANGAYVGLAPPGDVGSWQREVKGYQFWTRADADGYFSIRNVRLGDYNLYAWVHGFIGDYRNDKVTTITPGYEIHMGDIVYKPPRYGPTLWEIGIPDRSAREFYVPDPIPKYINKLYVNHPDRFRQYGLWERYAELYPAGDLVYTVGTSDYKKDWFFAQVRVNDLLANPPLFTSGKIGKDNAIARHGIHGIYWLFSVDVPSNLLQKGDNTIFLTQPRNQSPFQGIMYDYIRLEGPPA